MLNHHLFTLSIEQTEDQNRSDPLPDRSPRLTPTPIRVSLSVVPMAKSRLRQVAFLGAHKGTHFARAQ
jgi:hypothetical protein